MTWEWSHSQDGYDHAREALENFALPELAVIAAEWDVFEHSEADEDAPAFDQKFYRERLEFYSVLTVDVLAEVIWAKMEVLRSCTNGGHALWGCPYGCDCHLIPVGGEENEA